MQVIIFGVTGMVGQGVLRECLIDPGIDRVLAVGRSPTVMPSLSRSSTTTSWIIRRAAGRLVFPEISAPARVVAYPSQRRSTGDVSPAQTDCARRRRPRRDLHPSSGTPP